MVDTPTRCVVCSGGRRQEDLCSSGVTVLDQDFMSALETLQDVQSKAIGAPKVRNRSRLMFTETRSRTENGDVHLLLVVNDHVSPVTSPVGDGTNLIDSRLQFDQRLSNETVCLLVLQIFCKILATP